MNSKDVLITQFTNCYDENSWFVAAKNAIKSVTAEQADWKPAVADNSIREIINHLNYYNNAYLERFKRNEYEYKVADNDETFDKGEAPNWQAEAERFDAIMSGWRTELERADDARFDELAPPNNQMSWAQLVANMNAHNAYHGGQIVLLQKLQESWDTERGVS
jgi:uncharacterized damage-inducible protein DinB